MTLRSVVLAILSLLALIFLILNWQGITASVPVNLIVEEIQAPLGLILLVILGGLWLFGIAWALMQQASTLVEIRKAYKEANANKSLADHAEQSRLEQTKESLRQEMVKQGIPCGRMDGYMDGYGHRGGYGHHGHGGRGGSAQSLPDRHRPRLREIRGAAQIHAQRRFRLQPKPPPGRRIVSVCSCRKMPSVRKPMNRYVPTLPP